MRDSTVVFIAALAALGLGWLGSEIRAWRRRRADDRFVRLLDSRDDDIRNMRRPW